MCHEFHILLIDDSPTDVIIIQRALRECGVSHRLTLIPDGHKALEFLRGSLDPSAPTDREPDLILLDLNLPGIDGLHVLAEIKTHPELKILPVVVLTSSSREEDLRQSYQAGANSYLQKPAEYQQYRELVAAIERYWSETNIRPRRRGPDMSSGR